MTRLCIGTVQFGMDYGVQGGMRPAAEDAVKMLDYATQNGVDAIDTAAAYGTAEEVVGLFLRRKTMPRERLQVISKFGTKIFEGMTPAEYASRLREAARISLCRLGTDYLDAYICHDPDAVGDAAIVAAMASLKDSGIARHVGFSVYDPEQVRTSLKSAAVDFIQAPFSFLDRRAADSGALSEAKANGVDLHTRSAFVQGLMLMDAARIPDHLAAARPIIQGLEAACAQAGMTRRELALAYVKSNPDISHLVFGVDDLRQLKEIVEDFAKPVDPAALQAIADRFAGVDPSIFLPKNWNAKK